MKWSENTPLLFTNGESFVKHFGDRVWEELCDNYPVDTVLSISKCAKEMQTLVGRKNPAVYLRQVLKNIQTVNTEAGEDVPFEVLGKRMIQIVL